MEEIVAAPAARVEVFYCQSETIVLSVFKGGWFWSLVVLLSMYGCIMRIGGLLDAAVTVAAIKPSIDAVGYVITALANIAWSGNMSKACIFKVPSNQWLTLTLCACWVCGAHAQS